MSKACTRAAIALILVAASTLSSAMDLVWDGKNYLDIGLRLGADSSLVFPEPVEMTAEQPNAFSAVESTTDQRIMSIRPLQLQEQRVTFIGATTKTIYLARFSTRATYSPLYRVRNAATAEAARAAATSRLTPTGLMKAMMAGKTTNGITSRQHSQEIVIGPDYRIVAAEIWETPSMTGIIGTLTMAPERSAIVVRPSDISLQIPAFGNQRMMGADRWEIDRDVPSTAVYFVFTR